MIERKKILVVGPLPPPHTGNSLPVQMLVDTWSKSGHEVHAISFSSTSLISGNFSFKKLFIWLRIYSHLLKNKKQYDYIYLSVAESTFGNFRDLLFYFLLGDKRSNVIIHLLGGNTFKNIVQSEGFIGKVNRYFLERILYIVVESEYQKSFFSSSQIQSKVKVVENFAEDSLFTSRELITQKFNSPDKIRILFLSNLLYGKGHLELLEAFISLPEIVRNKFELHFAGNLVYDPNADFLLRVGACKNVVFHGFINGEKKKELLASSHIFCLPTYYPFEGLPFSIIESYASGCVGVMTGHSGIPFIFSDQINGYMIEKNNIDSIIQNFIRISKEVDQGYEGLLKIALHNYNQALSRNRMSQFIISFDNMLFKKNNHEI
jgi:glycosyltransferase involved in cell wall biosynthesis